MKLQLALVELEGVQFALVAVESGVLDDAAASEQAVRYYEEWIFRDLPVVLVREEGGKAPRFWGREDLVEIMRGVQIDRIEWTRLDLPQGLPS